MESLYIWKQAEEIGFRIDENFNFEKYVNCNQINQVKAILNYYLNRRGTKIAQFILHRVFDVIPYFPMLEVEKLTLWGDQKVGNLFLSSQLKELKIYGKVFYDLFKFGQILNSETVTIMFPSPEVKMMAIQKFSNTKRLVFSANQIISDGCFLPQEILEFAMQNRAIGSILDYNVEDYFNFKNYPHVGSLVSCLNARFTRLPERKCITVPMQDAELNCFIIPANELKYKNTTWILRLEVMEKGTAKERKK